MTSCHFKRAVQPTQNWLIQSQYFLYRKLDEKIWYFQITLFICHFHFLKNVFLEIIIYSVNEL